ncbi:hypothetical protein [aff. Roholtiella sp. LEGE 12411]|uniref:hypothetical protein n=1 Tax=aff. Roholtiella sp. LEGE 12411 TaxID=1828822 RepID=UPI001882E3E8|nr:hypothetical protein [aff. Roholtiella sp. LEGE 12411]MBE9036410.1 hypothetical protein [aff. Roholtiella sp. LEGE 12411]
MKSVKSQEKPVTQRGKSSARPWRLPLGEVQSIGFRRSDFSLHVTGSSGQPS